MLSKHYDIKEFVEKIKGRSFDEVIFLTDQEATETERHLYKNSRNTVKKAARQYAVSLKDFILFIRYGVVTRSTRDLNLKVFGKNTQ